MVAVPEGRMLTPLAHLRAWLAASGITAGPVFRPLWKGGKRVRDAGLSDHAVVAEALASIRRSRSIPPDRKAPADAEFLSALLNSIAGDGLAAVRDRALLALGMALAARRSELVALEVRDLDWGDQACA